MLAAVEKKETLSERVAVASVPPSGPARVPTSASGPARVPPSGPADKKQVLKEMAEKKKLGLKRDEKKEEYEQSKRNNVEALRDPSTDEKTRKAHLKALRIKAVEEAMKEKSKNAAKAGPMKEDDFEEEEEDDLDPSSLVEAEMDENYEDTLVEVNIPGKHSSSTFLEEKIEVKIAGDDVLMPPNADGKVFCTICKGGPMQVVTMPF